MGAVAPQECPARTRGRIHRAGTLDTRSAALPLSAAPTLKRARLGAIRGIREKRLAPHQHDIPVGGRPSPSNKDLVAIADLLVGQATPHHPIDLGALRISAHRPIGRGTGIERRRGRVRYAAHKAVGEIEGGHKLHTINWG